MMRATIAALALACLTACSGDPVVDDPKNSEHDSVTWGDYAPAVKSGIDEAAASKDCDSLQRLFDNADANSAATQNRTGHGNADLMAYIDDAMKRAGCY